MATFNNQAALSYRGGTTLSNVVTGELVEVLSMTKTAVNSSYNQGDTVSYIISLLNTSSADIAGLTLQDNLGSYLFGTTTLTPLAYETGSVRYYTNGVLQTAPTVTAGPPLRFSGITVPAGGNATVVYAARVNEYAPLGESGSVTNTVTASADGTITPVTATETVASESSLALRILKSMSPTVVSENGTLTYTFTVENSGSTAATAADLIALTDTFDPVLRNISVSYNGTNWATPTNYTYDATTGAFATVAGQITVPAATFAQNPTTGAYTATPGTAVLTVTGTV